jgi:SAM-dependent methyltransferase
MIARDILDDVAHYYTDKLRQHGATPAGVDWRDTASQETRFAQLARLIESPHASVVDYGCGVGAMLPYLRARGHVGSYLGIDIAEEMIDTARALHANDEHARFLVGTKPDLVADFAIASGIFNVRLDHSETDWASYVDAMIAELDQFGRLGFAFNCLTSYSDPERMRRDLYYPDPCRLFDLCKRRYSRQVALLHDYGLWEFTIITRKPASEA